MIAGAVGNLVHRTSWNVRGPSDFNMNLNPKKNLCAQDREKIPKGESQSYVCSDYALMQLAKRPGFGHSLTTE